MPTDVRLQIACRTSASVPGLTSCLSSDTGHFLFLRVLQRPEEEATQKQSEWQTHYLEFHTYLIEATRGLCTLGQGVRDRCISQLPGIKNRYHKMPWDPYLQASNRHSPCQPRLCPLPWGTHEGRGHCLTAPSNDSNSSLSSIVRPLSPARPSSPPT